MILVTGAAGFIGSNLCDELLKNNKVIGIDNFNDYYDPAIKHKNLEEAKKNENFTFAELDLNDFNKLREVFANNKIEAVVHLAGRGGVRPSIENPHIYVKDNIACTLNVLELCKEFDVKKLVFGSSSSVYGANTKIPFSETDPVEDQISPYGYTKRSCEQLCRTYSNIYGINIVCLRFFTVYGSRGRPDMAVFKFTKAISEDKEITVYGDGSAERDFTYVSDIVQGIIASIEADVSFEIINLGNNKPITVKDLISIVESKLDKKASVKNIEKQQGDMEKTYADIGKAKEVLNWEPKTAPEEGIEKFVEWYKDQV